MALPLPGATHQPRPNFTELDETLLEEQTKKVDSYVIEHILEFAPASQLLLAGINKHLTGIHTERKEQKEREEREAKAAHDAALRGRYVVVEFMKMTVTVDLINPGQMEHLVEQQHPLLIPPPA